MKEVYHIETISELNNILNQEKPKHPLVSVVDFSKVESFGENNVKTTLGFYSIMLKNNHCGKLKYGREYFDFQEGTLICIAPKQVAAIENESDQQNDVSGWGLFFHPDLIRGTSLGSKMKDYNFFFYEVNEALHLSDKEKQTLNDCVTKIENELSQNIDQHSQNLIVSNIELLLNYCIRFYDRQFITRKNSNKDTLAKFENMLTNYFKSDKLKNNGLPSVKYCADQLFLSPNYLSDLLKKETGKNAQDHIHYYLIEEAKNNLLNTNATISEVAYNLGFEYPQYFSKLFKSKTGTTPAEYRSLS
ncbi:helix-turn-helix domain-containing protein [Pedobacter rhodius]|uniref:Helix-turn-helix transcriptional regulator n=1 Tax=Pedobacter rhodius TaxID=3004098 RepID=A0ABT4KWN7_9SPHI|nr:AraC family transcriptional regulator [Pedobacter sp. SJ11]MCZ4223332.1 helix-turn-helix transcriptional regulator [Pedobacter sp. SJ11]